MVTTATTVVGKVDILSPRGTGLKLVGEPEWLNVSKFAQPAPILPEKGQVVALTLNAKGFVVGIAPIVETPAPSTPVNGNGHHTAATVEEPSAEQPTGTPPDRERTITRMATLNTAVNILASGSRAVNAEDVLVLASRLEGWVYRNA